MILALDIKQLPISLNDIWNYEHKFSMKMNEDNKQITFYCEQIIVDSNCPEELCNIYKNSILIELDCILDKKILCDNTSPFYLPASIYRNMNFIPFINAFKNLSMINKKYMIQICSKLNNDLWLNVIPFLGYGNIETYYITLCIHDADNLYRYLIKILYRYQKSRYMN
jgi:hypothetical protein